MEGGHAAEAAHRLEARGGQLSGFLRMSPAMVQHAGDIFGEDSWRLDDGCRDGQGGGTAKDAFGVGRPAEIAPPSELLPRLPLCAPCTRPPTSFSVTRRASSSLSRRRRVLENSRPTSALPSSRGYPSSTSKWARCERPPVSAGCGLRPTVLQQPPVPPLARPKRALRDHSSRRRQTVGKSRRARAVSSAHA